MGKNPAWSWYITWYFFVGGVAAGAYLVAALVEFVGQDRDRRVARVGYGLAVPLVALSAILLSLDLGMPGRAFQMFRAFRGSSPMSVGAWGLLAFGLVSLASLLLALRDRPADRRLRRVLAIPGGVLGLFIASYTGVLLGATNRPVWVGNNWIGPLFLVSAVSTGVAALALLLAGPPLAGFARIHLFSAPVEALLLIFFLQSLGAGAMLFLAGALAPLFWGGVVVAGLALPVGLVLVSRPAAGARATSAGALGLARARGLEAVAALLVLVGGLALRYVVLTGGQM